MSWSARLLIGLVLIIVGAGATAWTLGHYPQAARYLGITQPAPSPEVLTPKPVVMNPQPEQKEAAATTDQQSPEEAAQIRVRDQQIECQLDSVALD